MSTYLAVQAALRDAPAAWPRTTFKRLTRQVKTPNSEAQEPLLSLSSDGGISVRADMGGLGRQAPSDKTITDYWVVRPDQVVVNPMWLVGGSVGVSQTSGAVSPAYRIYEPSRLVLPRYLHYVLRSRPYLEQYRLLGRGDTTFDRSVSREDFESLPIPLPPVETQRSIADFLDDQVAQHDYAIRLRERQTSELRQAFWSWLLEQVEAERAPVMPLRRVLSFVADGPFGSAFSSSDYVADGPAVVRLGNIGFGEYKEAEQARVPEIIWSTFPRCRVRPGDLLIASLGDGSNHAGRACVAPDGLGAAMVKGKSLCARVRPDKADARFLALLMSSPLGAEIFNLETRGSTRSMINIEILKSVRLPLPCVERQALLAEAAIVRRREYQSQVALAQRGAALLCERRQALITAAVTGQLHVAGAWRAS